jgi:pentatricopeptide repeat protein
MYSKLQQPDEAVLIFEQMLANGIQPNATVFNAMIDMYGKMKLVLESQYWFKRMIEASVCTWFIKFFFFCVSINILIALILCLSQSSDSARSSRTRARSTS